MELLENMVLCDSGVVVLRVRTYRDRAGATKTWSYVERKGVREAVVIAARTRTTGSLVMIRQFRVPFGHTLVELPAGLVDPGESLEAAAVRELGEETGYTGQVLRVGPALSSSAGLTTETYHMVWMVVDEEPRERHPEDTESIQVFTVHPAHARGRLEAWEREGALLDGKAYFVLRSLDS